MKRILYIHHGGALGGAPLSLLYLLQQLDRDLYEPVVLCLAYGPMVERFQAEGIETHVITNVSDFSHTTLVWYGGKLLWQLLGKVLRFWPSVAACRRALRHFQPDLVHINSSTLAAAARAARLEGIPVVWHIREPLERGYVGLRRSWLRREINCLSDCTIAISEHDAAQLIPSPRVRVINNFVDFSTFDRNIPSSTARAKLNISSAQHLVTMLGGCSEPKGTLPFVEALTLVRQQVPHVSFLVVGRKPRVGASEPDRAWLRRLLRMDSYDRSVIQAANETIAMGYIRFSGQRSDIPELLAASDLIVFPSIVPHFGRPIIEAGAMAKPVVASDLAGPQDLVVNGETGLLAPPGDAAGLARCIVSILTDPSHAQDMGEAGYRRARALYKAQRNSASTFAVYDEILGDARE